MADDPALSRHERGKALFELFASYVKPGFTSEQMRATLPDTRWLEACSLVRIGAVGGAIDVEWSSGDIFCLRLCPDNEGWSDWVIDFSLTDARGFSARADEALAFLQGTLTNKQVRLAEFNLFYPIGPPIQQGNISLSERFTAKGVGLKVHQ